MLKNHKTTTYHLLSSVSQQWAAWVPIWICAIVFGRQSWVIGMEPMWCTFLQPTRKLTNITMQDHWSIVNNQLHWLKLTISVASRHSSIREKQPISRFDASNISLSWCNYKFWCFEYFSQLVQLKVWWPIFVCSMGSLIQPAGLWKSFLWQRYCSTKPSKVCCV